MIPRHLDDPPMVFMWDADEAGIFIFTDAVRCPVSAIHRGNRPGVSRGTGTGPDQTGRGGKGVDSALSILVHALRYLDQVPRTQFCAGVCRVKLQRFRSSLAAAEWSGKLWFAVAAVMALSNLFLTWNTRMNDVREKTVFVPSEFDQPFWV